MDPIISVRWSEKALYNMRDKLWPQIKELAKENPVWIDFWRLAQSEPTTKGIPILFAFRDAKLVGALLCAHGQIEHEEMRNGCFTLNQFLVRKGYEKDTKIFEHLAQEAAQYAHHLRHFLYCGEKLNTLQRDITWEIARKIGISDNMVLDNLHKGMMTKEQIEALRRAHKRNLHAVPAIGRHAHDADRHEESAAFNWIHRRHGER